MSVFFIIRLAVTAQGTMGKVGLLGASQKKPTSDSCTALATSPGALGRRVGPAYLNLLAPGPVLMAISAAVPVS